MDKDLSELGVGNSSNLADPSSLVNVAVRKDYGPQISPICTDFLRRAVWMRRVEHEFAGCHAFLKTEELDMDNLLNRGWLVNAGLSLVRLKRTEQAWKAEP